MSEPHVIGALRNKRAELAGVVVQLERRLSDQRADLTHLDATLRLFDPTIRLTDIRPRRQYARNTWYRHGECLRLIYDALREAGQPVTTRDLSERIMLIKPHPPPRLAPAIRCSGRCWPRSTGRRIQSRAPAPGVLSRGS